MAVKEYKVMLSASEIQHLISYCQHWEQSDDGKWYYGLRQQFEDRHMRIREKLAQAISGVGKEAPR